MKSKIVTIWLKSYHSSTVSIRYCAFRLPFILVSTEITNKEKRIQCPGKLQKMSRAVICQERFFNGIMKLNERHETKWQIFCSIKLKLKFFKTYETFGNIMTIEC